MSNEQTQLITIHIDGLCQPRNPGGYACWAYSAADDAGREVGMNYGCIGSGPGMSNNVAEYTALVEALKRVEHEGWLGCAIRSDSQLLVNQVNGEWHCNNAALFELLTAATTIIERVQPVITWVPREQNKRADYLTNVAYNKARLASKG